MIGNISKGRGFRGTLNYLLEKEQGELIGGNMLGQTARELAAEFKLSRQLNPTIKQPVYHVSLSLPHPERLDDEKWNEIARDYLQQMGFTDNQYVVVRHSDRSHDHIHLVAARGRLDGKCVSDWQDYYRSQKAIRCLEQKYQLEVVAPSWEVERRGLTKGQFEQQRWETAAQLISETSPTTSVRQSIQDNADQMILECTTPEQFIEKMNNAGVDVQLRTRRDGSISGISYSYELDDITVATSGTGLGTNYTWNGINRRIQSQQQQHSPEVAPDSGLGEEQNLLCMNPQQLWSHYSFEVDALTTDVAEIATRRALRDGQPHATIQKMLEQCSSYQSCERQYGTENAQDVAQIILNASIRKEQQQARAVAKTLSLLLNQMGWGERQPDGDLVFQGQSYECRDKQDTISLIALDGRGEILRVTDGQVVVDTMTSQDIEKSDFLRQQINQDRLDSVQQKHEQEQSQELSL